MIRPVMDTGFPIIRPGDHDSSARWPVILKQTAGAELPISGPPVDFLAGTRRLASWDGTRFHIHQGYACDGYSPVLRLFGRWIPITPIPACGLWPAILHDALRQFLPVPGCPWTRQDTDEWFYNALIAGGLTPHHAGLYHGAVAGPATVMPS